MLKKFKILGILFGTICFIGIGFFYFYNSYQEIRAAADFVADTFDTNNPGGDPEYYIALKENLVISAGQVILEEEPVVCDSGGVPQTTGWGENLYGCVGPDKRCYNGTCVACGGWLYDDGCNGCAGQGVSGVHNRACWYAGDPGGSCTSACVSRGCVQANWNDDSSCSVGWELSYNPPGCAHFCGGGAATSTRPCFWASGGVYSDCHIRAGADQVCENTPEEGAAYARLCVCNY